MWPSFLLLLVGFFSIFLPTKSSLCEFTAGKYNNADMVMDCYRTIPFNNTIREQTLDTLLKALPLYAFLDLAEDSPDPHFPMSVDLIGGLKALQNVTYQYDYQFHYDIGQMFMELRDAHTDYNAPVCYQNFLWWQPFAIAAYSPDHEQLKFAVTDFFPSDALVDYYQKVNGVNIKEFAGAEVLSVNYLAAKDYFLNLADHVGLAKDKNTRLNLLMAGFNPTPGDIGVTLGLFQTRQRWGWNTMPFNEESVAYTFRMPNGAIQTHNFPWAVTSRRDITGTDSFLSLYYPSPERAKADLKDYKLRTTGLNIDHDRPKETILHFVDTQHKAGDSSMPVFLLGNQHYKFYLLKEGSQIGVIWMADMEDFEDVPRLLNQTFHKARELNVTKVILDLTNNGGGYICLGRYLLDYLFRGKTYAPTDMPYNPTSAQLAKLSLSLPTSELNRTFWSAWQFANATNVDYPLHDDSWLVDGVVRTRAGHQKRLSQILHLSHRSTLTECCDILPPRPPTTPPLWDPEDMIMITHGLCGSTCAEFANHAHQYYHVKVFAVGGVPGTQMQYTSFPGIQVFDSRPDLDPMWALLKSAPGPHNLVPDPLPTSGEYRMCVREIYGPPPTPETAIPLEFTWQPADYHIVPTTVDEAVNPWKLWFNVSGIWGTTTGPAHIS